MTIDKSFFNTLKEEMIPIIKNLSAQQTLKDTEREIKKIIEKWNGNITTKGRNLEQDQIARNLCLIAMSFILLYRQRYFNELSRNPSNFIMEFFKSIIPESLLNNMDKRNLEKNILGVLADVAPSEWAQIACPINPQITILVWNKISYSTDNSLITSIGALKEQEDEHFTIDGIELAGTYEEYKWEVDQKLQSQIGRPDLILMDSILLAEYKSKGALYTASYYISEKDLRDKIKRLAEKEIGTTVNGHLEAIPITRNFHVPGRRDDFFDDELKKVLVDDVNAKIKFSDILEAHKQDRGIHPKWKSWLELNQFFPYSLLGTTVVKNQTIKPNANINNIDGQFVTSMGDEIPFIPMQAARGAHITYTFFAYLAGASKEDERRSFITVEKTSSEEKRNLCLHIYSSELIRKRIESFLWLIYLYVPVISLCLDHVRAGVMRSGALGNLWFDPCLPIEAQKFQDEKIKLYTKPIAVTLNNASLSCLGGYCLALTDYSNAKHQTVKQALELAEKYYDNIDKSHPPSDFNCRIDYNARVHKEEHKNISYIDTPEKIAKRPNFHGWGAIEGQISNIVRQYMATVMITRALVAECKLDQDMLERIHDIEAGSEVLDNMSKYLQRDVVSETSIREYLSRAKEMIEKFFMGRSENKFYTPGVKQETDKWVKSNFDDLIEDRDAILGLLQSTIKKPITDETKIIEEIMQYLAGRMSETLVNKLEALCHNAEWEVKFVDR